MVARIRPETGLRVTFFRAGEEAESETASTGERALKVALLILARLDYLQDGDVLVVADGTRKAPR
jgi:hypothetical protein